MPLAGLVICRAEDEPAASVTLDLLESLGAEPELRLIPAYVNLEALQQYAAAARGRGLQALAGFNPGGFNLAGLLAAASDLPVIGVPISSGPQQGLDALLATAQTPSGAPIAAMGLGESGARNAALHIARILGLQHEGIRQAHERYFQRLREG